MRLLIVGATGGTGRELVAQALERGHDVTALARRPERMRVAHPRLRVVSGDVLDPEAVDRAVEDREAVISALGHKRWFYPNRILSDGTANLVRAMERRGVRRFVCQTSLGVGTSWWEMGLYYTLFTIPFILPLYYFDKHRQERVVRGSALDWTIVRPARLTNGRKRGAVRSGAHVGNAIWTKSVSRADVAAFLLDQAASPELSGKVVGVAY